MKPPWTTINYVDHNGLPHWLLMHVSMGVSGFDEDEKGGVWVRWETVGCQYFKDGKPITSDEYESLYYWLGDNPDLIVEHADCEVSASCESAVGG